MTHREIRKEFIEFFKSKGHKEISPSPLVPEYDPTLLFVDAGMVPLKPYFLGRKEPPAKRLYNIQPCLRTEDLDKVGKSRHTLTFFEMMGTWSIGDYFKERAIAYAWEFLTQKVNLDSHSLWATVFAGSEELEADQESIDIWKKMGLPEERIVPLPASDNLWVSGPTGPFGPCTEVYYDRGEEYGCGKPDCKPGCDCDRFVEIWNPGVFMMYDRKEDGSFEELPFKSVDTGAGLERFALVLENKDSVFETDLLFPIYQAASRLVKASSGERSMESLRIITDHVRAATFLVKDGVVPSNKGQGYVLRRLIRRAALHGRLLGQEAPFLFELVPSVAQIFSGIYSFEEKEIQEVLKKEEENFASTLRRGLRELEKIIAGVQDNRISGYQAFKLYDTYGFPLELTEEIAQERGLEVGEEGFEREMEKQKERARKAQKFKEYPQEKIAPLHTATHLLNEALRRVLGPEVRQAGQDLTPERLRFDFTLDRKLTEEELGRIEEIVNGKIKEDLPVECVETTYEQAVKEGAQALFKEKYQEADQVTMYKINDFSKELCGGPHVSSTGELGHFKIVKEENLGSGVRRIRAVLQ